LNCGCPVPEYCVMPPPQPKALLVHGFNVDDGGKRTIRQIEPMLVGLGYKTKHFCYGKLSLLGVRMFNDNAAAALAEYLFEEEISVVLGHSNGCAMIQTAAWMLHERCPPVRAVYISPALDRKSELSPCIQRCDVLSTVHDKAVKWAAIIPFHQWGNMGAYGPKTSDPRYHHHAMPEITGHSDWFSEKSLNVHTLPRLRQILKGGVP
jgi:hypothetical protein